MKRTLHIMHCICLLLLVSTLGQRSQAQLSGLLVGAALDKLMDQVNTAIISARNAGNSVAIEAGREVAISIRWDRGGPQVVRTRSE